MRLRLTCFCLLLSIFHGFSQEGPDPDFLATQEEHILSFHSDIRVRRNCSVLITETIYVVAKGWEIQHGIFRDLPLSYDYKGAHVVVDFELLSVKHNGDAEADHTEKMSNGIRIYVGSGTSLLDPGVHSFEITYKVDHVLGIFDRFDEIYWNVNGNGWAFVADTVSADIHLPPGAKTLQQSGYTGEFGSRGKDFVHEQLSETHHRFTTTRKMLPGENLTVAIGWNKNALSYPSAGENFLYWLKGNSVWIISVLGLLLALLWNFISWWRFGRDPRPGTIVPLYYAPDNLSPAECGHLYRYGRPSEELFAASLISLATKQLIQIEVEEIGRVLKVRNFTLRTKKDAFERAPLVLNDIEHTFFLKLFNGRSQVSIRRKSYNPHLSETQDALHAHLAKKQGEHYFASNRRLKQRQFIVPILTLLTGMGLFVLFGGPVGILLGAFGVMLVLNFVFMRLYEQPTAAGRKILDEIAGFRLYMQYADKERLRLVNPPDMTFDYFEQNLPYAIALGVAENWAEQFEPAELERMYTTGHFWYTGAAIHTFGAFSFNELSSTISSASVPPSASGGGFSGGGSFGGGFSGGGGGGGGGGGW